VLSELEGLGNKRVREDMGKRFGIHTDKAWGVRMVDLQKVSKAIGTDHQLAQQLWKSGWYEAKALATLVADPKQVTPTQMDAWCADFQNWADCDTACFLLFDKTPHAFNKVKQWAKRKPEFEKRAAFALLASCALHDKKGPDKPYLELLPLCEKAANDERNFVKKAVSWALRSMGSRSVECREAALEVAERLAVSAVKTERWVGKDVLRDLRRPLVERRVERKKSNMVDTKRK
jgi:3-methyladenine DNA glycosylase AlkD